MEILREKLNRRFIRSWSSSSSHFDKHDDNDFLSSLSYSSLSLGAAAATVLKDSILFLTNSNTFRSISLSISVKWHHMTISAWPKIWPTKLTDHKLVTMRGWHREATRRQAKPCSSIERGAEPAWWWWWSSWLMIIMIIYASQAPSQTRQSSASYSLRAVQSNGMATQRFQM